MHDLIPLSALRAGQTGLVEQVVGVPEQVRRMEELGMRDGATVEMIQSGNPCIVHLGGQKLCFRGNDILSVLVRLGASA